MMKSIANCSFSNNNSFGVFDSTGRKPTNELFNTCKIPQCEVLDTCRQRYTLPAVELEMSVLRKLISQHCFSAKFHLC